MRRPDLESRPADPGRASRAIRWLQLSILASLLVPAAIFVAVVLHTRQATLAEAQAGALRSVATVAEHAVKVFDTNGLVIAMVDEATRGLSCAELRASKEIPASMARMVRHAPQIETVFVLDEHGFICTASEPTRVDESSRADREYFQGARDAALDPHIGEPAFYTGRGLIGRIGAVPFFSLARRRTGADPQTGSFRGIVLAVVELKYMLSYWREIVAPGTAQRMALFRSDGALLVRSTEPLVQNADPALEARFRSIWSSSPQGVEIAPGVTDGTERVRAWKVLPGWNLVAVTSFDKSVVLRPWWDAVRLYAIAAALASLALLGASASALQWVRREQAAARQGEMELSRRLDLESELQQARKMEAMGQLTGGVAHDFNNLLAAITGSLELVRKRLSYDAGIGADPRIARLLENAQQAAERGAILTQRMLAFARRQPLSPRGVDVCGLIQGMSDLLQRSAGPFVRLETAFPARLSPAHVDPHQLELALLNLVVNGRDAIAAQGGEGTIAISAREQTIGLDDRAGLKPGAYVCISVCDTGEGMDEGTLRRATEPFFTTKEIGKGTGLGLSMVHGLAEQLGGRLLLKSRRGEGTTAELWLPRAEFADVELMPTRLPSREPSGGTTAAQCLHILLVDDDPLVLAGTKEMLEDLGHEVAAASSGQDALELLRRGVSCDLVITDYAMPSLTGAQLAAELRVLRPELPVILASGHAELPASMERPSRVLAKPFTQAALATALAEQHGAAQQKVSSVILFKHH